MVWVGSQSGRLDDLDEGHGVAGAGDADVADPVGHPAVLPTRELAVGHPEVVLAVVLHPLDREGDGIDDVGPFREDGPGLHVGELEGELGGALAVGLVHVKQYTPVPLGNQEVST